MAWYGMVALALGSDVGCTSSKGLVDNLDHRDLYNDPEPKRRKVMQALSQWRGLTLNLHEILFGGSQN